MIFSCEINIWFVINIILLLSTFICIMTILLTIMTLNLRFIIPLTLCLILAWSLTWISISASSIWAWGATSSTSVWASSYSSSSASTLTKLYLCLEGVLQWGACYSIQSMFMQNQWCIKLIQWELWEILCIFYCHNNGLKPCWQTSQNFLNYSSFLRCLAMRLDLSNRPTYMGKNESIFSDSFIQSVSKSLLNICSFVVLTFAMPW